MANKSVSIRKFSRAQILFHWVYGVSWILLVLTGIIFIWRPDPTAPATGLGPMLQGAVGQSARFLHRVGAIGLMAAPLIWLLGDVKSLWPDLKELLVWTKADFKYMAVAPIHYTTGKGTLPPQGKYNGGHKLNFYVVILTFIAFVISGVTMWFFRGTVSDETFKLMLGLHSLAFWGGLAMGVVHIYLTLIHPFTSQAFSSMVNGYVSLRYAKAEHQEWVEKELASGKADLVEKPHAG